MAEEPLKERIRRCLEREGGHATVERLLYAYSELKDVGRERLLEEAGRSFRVFKAHGYTYVALEHVDPEKVTPARRSRDE